MAANKIDKARPSRSRDAEASKAAILSAAVDEFVEMGFHGARTGSIARRASVPQGLLYHYFKSKEELFHAVIHQALAPYFQSTMAMLEAPEIEPGFDLLERAIRLYFTFLRNNPSVVRLLAWSQAIQVRQSSPKLLDPELCASPMALGAERLTEAQNAGRIRSDIPPVHIIKLFLDLCLAWHMSVLDFCLDIGTDPNDTTTVDRMHEAHLEFILATLRSGLALEPAQNGEAR